LRHLRGRWYEGPKSTGRLKAVPAYKEKGRGTDNDPLCTATRTWSLSMAQHQSDTSPPADDFITRKLAERDQERTASEQLRASVQNTESQVLRGRLTQAQALAIAEAARVAAVEANTTAEAACAAAVETNKNILKGLDIAVALEQLGWELRTSVQRSRCLAKGALLGLLVLAIILGWAIYYFKEHALQVEAMLKESIPMVVPADGEVSLNIGQWQSDAFDTGRSSCAPYTDKDGKILKPCENWTPLGIPNNSAPLDVFKAEQGSSLLLIIAGGHDRQPLTASFAREVGSNEQLAQLRASAVSNYFLNQLESIPPHHRPSIQRVLVSRGASNVTSVTDEDRTVVVTLVRLTRS
jgi:hypothetical protein